MLINVCLLSVLLLVGLAAVAPEACSSGPRRRCRLSRGWRFHRGDVEGASAPGFDDSSWRPVQLPHDWSVEDLPADDLPVEPGTTPVRSGPFSSDSVGAGAVGYTVGGIGWYRRTFEAPASLRGKRVTLLFDGVYMDCEVWVNGTSLGRHPYGYTSFGFDVTPHLLPGESNVIAVRVDASGKTSRWYPGAGIYRHVWLVATEPLHLGHWGTAITTPEVSREQANVHATCTVCNDGDAETEATLVCEVFDAEGNLQAATAEPAAVKPGEAEAVIVSLIVGAPKLWSPDSPTLYRLLTRLVRQDEVLDAEEIAFGIRTISLDAESGFVLNGQPMKLRGGCVHHDNGPLGACTYDRAEERRVELLRAAGFNAIRTAHNPPSPAFLDACDRIGMLVIDEAFDPGRRALRPGRSD